jgi:hypothetical protein
LHCRRVVPDRDQAAADRIGREGEHYRDYQCRLPSCNGVLGRGRDNDIDVKPDKLGRDLSKPRMSCQRSAGEPSAHPGGLERNVATLDPTKFLQALAKRCNVANFVESGHAE